MVVLTVPAGLEAQHHREVSYILPSSMLIQSRSARRSQTFHSYTLTPSPPFIPRCHSSRREVGRAPYEAHGANKHDTDERTKRFWFKVVGCGESDTADTRGVKNRKMTGARIEHPRARERSVSVTDYGYG